MKSRFIIYVFVLYKFYRIFRKVPNSNIYLLQILFYYFYYNTVYIVCAAENLLSDIKFTERESAPLNTTTKRKTKYCGLSWHSTSPQCLLKKKFLWKNGIWNCNKRKVSWPFNDNATNQIRMKIYWVHIQTAWVENCFGQRKLLKRTANNAKLGTCKKLNRTALSADQNELHKLYCKTTIWKIR